MNPATRWLLLALACVIAPAQAAPARCDDRVTPAALLANPDHYDGKAVWVVATATIEFENMTACPPDTDANAGSCLWLDIDDGPYASDQDFARYEAKRQAWLRYNRKTVAIHATFDKTITGHLGGSPAGLRGVTEVSGRKDGWNFVTHSAEPRSACAGEPR